MLPLSLDLEKEKLGRFFEKFYHYFLYKKLNLHFFFFLNLTTFFDRFFFFLNL